MKKKIFSVLLSVVLAFVLWYYVITVISPNSKETFYNIPVVLTGETALEERGLMVTSVGNTTVDLTLSGNRSDLIQLNSSNITIKANLNTIYDPGENIRLDYTASYPGSFANNAFVEESKSPSYITVTVEKRTNKNIPVNVIYSGAVAEDYTALKDELYLDNETIRISGPESVVSQITQAVIEVSLEDRTESVAESYRYTLCDKNGDPVDAALITVSVEEVELTVPVRMVKTIALKVNVVGGGGATEETTTIQIEPAEIKVYGTAAALEGFDELTLGTIKLGEYEKATELTFDIALPDGVTNMTGLKQAQVSVKFPSLSTQTLTIEQIQLINLPEGLEAELTTQILEITLRGPKDQISSITTEDVTVAVDLSGAEPGTVTRKATITLNSNFKDCGAMGSYSVSLTLVNGEDN